MPLGLEQALAEYLAAQLGHGLYSDPNPALRVVFVALQPPVPEAQAPPVDAGETTAQLAVTVFADGGAAPQLTLLETHTITVQTRHPLYAQASFEARRVHDLLHQNGGAGYKAHAQGRFGAAKVLRIDADFPPTPLGRDPAPRDGRALFTQSFTVRVKAPLTFA